MEKKEDTDVYLDKINIGTGTVLNIEIKGVSIVLKSVFIGMEPDNYLIIKIPHPYLSIKHKLFKGNDIIIKYLYKGTVYKFESKLAAVINIPLKLLILEYPKTILHHALRNNKRIECCLPAKLIISGKEKMGAIMDICNNGCGWQIPLKEYELSPPVKVEDKIIFMCQFPGIEGDLALPGVVKNVKKQLNDIVLGILFDKISLETQRAIEEYIVSIEDFSH